MSLRVCNQHLDRYVNVAISFYLFLLTRVLISPSHLATHVSPPNRLLANPSGVHAAERHPDLQSPALAQE
jgi:hypothetical protein